MKVIYFMIWYALSKYSMKQPAWTNLNLRVPPLFILHRLPASFPLKFHVTSIFLPFSNNVITDKLRAAQSSVGNCVAIQVSRNAGWSVRHSFILGSTASQGPSARVIPRKGAFPQFPDRSCLLRLQQVVTYSCLSCCNLV